MKNINDNINKALNKTINLFPFTNYIINTGTIDNSYYNIGKVALKYLQPNDKILDFGSGPCDKTAILQFLGFECYAYDDLKDNWHNLPGNKDKILSFANKVGINFSLAKHEEGLSIYKKNYFDMIILNDVLEHLHDSPRILLENLLELTKENGIILITVPNAVNIKKRIKVLFGKTNLPPFNSFYNYSGPWRGHIREYVRDDLIQLSRNLNLDIEELRGCDHMLHKLPNNIRYLYLLFTKYLDGWKDSWLLVARKILK